jgi:hypothetical protein
MEITYVGPFESVYVPIFDAEVAQGETVEVTDPDAAASLLDQPSNWRAKPTKPTKADPAKSTED